MVGLTLVETSQGVLAIGGFDGWRYSEEIQKLDCPDDKIKNCYWQEMDQKLKSARYYPVSIPIPESYDICN